MVAYEAQAVGAPCSPRAGPVLQTAQRLPTRASGLTRLPLKAGAAWTPGCPGDNLKPEAVGRSRETTVIRPATKLGAEHPVSQSKKSMCTAHLAPRPADPSPRPGRPAALAPGGLFTRTFMDTLAMYSERGARFQMTVLESQAKKHVLHVTLPT